MKKIAKHFALFVIGAIAYFEVELNWRYFTGHLPVHWTMAAIGGCMFVLIGGINEWFSWDMSLFVQSAIGAVTVTIVEFISGVGLNICLGLNIWDYSHLPLNVMGQICLPFFVVWFVLAAVAIVLDDFLRWILFREDFPHYSLF